MLFLFVCVSFFVLLFIYENDSYIILRQIKEQFKYPQITPWLDLYSS